MAKKVSAWDRMMDSKEVDRRTDGLDTFRQLSDEEVNLANRTFSKKRLQEFIDLKLKCFDQLINETDKKHRGDQLKQIQELGESEMSLVRGVGPKSLFQELAEQANKAAKTAVAEEKEKEEKLAKQKVDKEKEKTEKKEPNDRKATEEEKSKQVEEHPQVMVRLVPPGMMLPAGMPGMRPGAMPSDIPGMVLNVTDHAMREGQVPGAMGGIPPEALIAMQQSRNAPSGAYMTGLYRTMPPMAFPHFPMMSPVAPEYRTCTLPHVGVMDQTAKKEEPLEAKHTKSKGFREPPISEIDQKLKLLVQLEAARNVLQNRPSGTESSTADEFRNRLRKINRLQMQVVDDIMGRQGDLTLFDFMPELQNPEQREEARTTRTKSEHLKARTTRTTRTEPAQLEARVTRTTRTEPELEARTTRTTRTTRPVPEQLEARTTRTPRTEPAQLQARTTRTTRATRPVPEQLEARTTRTSRIEPELPEREESDESDSSTESEEEEVETEPRFNESRRFVTLHVPEDSEADVKVVPAVQPRADSPHRVCTGTSRLCSSANKRPLHDDSWDDSKSVITTFDIITLINSDDSYPYYGPPRAPPADCAPYEFYNDSAPHYHDVPPLVQSAPQPVFYDPVPRAETSFAQTNCAAQSPQFFAQQGASPVEIDVLFRGNWTYEDNVDGVGGFSGDVYGANGSQLVATSKEPDLLSNNVVPVGRPEAAVQTEAAEKNQAASNVTTQPTQARPLQVAAAVQVSIPQLELQQGRQEQEQQEVATKQGSPNNDQLAKICRDSLLGIAASVDNILDSLNSLQADRPRRTRRYRDKDYDDDGTSDSESDSYSDYDNDPPRGRKGRSGSRSPERRRKSPESQKSSSVFSWLCGSVCNTKPSAKEGNQGDARLIKVANRIRELVQKVVYASNEVIEARKAIQQSGMLGQEGTQNVFAAEDKLWNLINLEGQLADGLSQYRLLDTSSNKEYCESLQQAEDKIRQLIEVETKLATEIGAWRQMTKQGAFSPSYTRTNERRRPDSAPGSPPAAVSISWRSGRRTAN